MNLLYPIRGCVLYMNEATRSLEPLAGHVQGERELVPCLIARVRCSDTCSSVLIRGKAACLTTWTQALRILASQDEELHWYTYRWC